MDILVNAFGITDSGGLAVFDKLLGEISINTSHQCHIICNKSDGIDRLKIKYYPNSNIQFILISNNGLLHRLYYENFSFRRLINNRNIQLIYNFSGSYQFFMKIPQIVKVQNLLFFSKKLDSVYIQREQFVLWVKQVLLKRIIFKFMLSRSRYVDIQSKHVKSHLSDFINTEDKIFFIKSDIDISISSFHKPKQYDFSKKIKFLYIVGPHFEYVHKNFKDFTEAMTNLDKKGVDFEINITLTKNQLIKSKLWNNNLNSKTNFVGYVSDRHKMEELFCDNTVLISTSIIETLGLHVVEAIKSGIVVIAPDESYADAVYGENMVKYKLFNSDSLLNSIMNVINDEKFDNKSILFLQDDLKKSEMSKYANVLDIFDEVVSVQG